MEQLSALQKCMYEVEAASDFKGYWFRVSDVLSIVVCGMLCGLENMSEIYDWATAKPVRAFLAEQIGIVEIPCKAQFYNIMGRVNAEQFGKSFIKWMQYVIQGGVAGNTVAIDGKTVCSTDKLTPDGSALHIASAIVSELGLVIGSRECGTKMGEITAFRELVGLLDVAGAVVVADALHCRKKSAQAVVDAGADYLFVVKDNQPTLRENIELYVQEEKLEKAVAKEKNGGRIETRTAYVSREIDWLESREEWANLACIGAIHTQFEKNDHKSSNWHYYISSAALSAEDLLRHARLEWGVEAMHWLLDVHFDEDKTRVRDMDVQKSLNHLRKITLNLAKQFKSRLGLKTSISGILRRNLFDPNHLIAFLSCFDED
jgi:predicted transposase YbfD/YdcC